MAKKRNFYDDQEAVEHLVKHHVNTMSTWECDFIDNIHNQLADGRWLSEKQGERLDEIWEALVVRRERQGG